MSSLAIALITIGCLFVGLMLGHFLRQRLPQHHLRDDSKDVFKMGTGLIGTLTALVLGLLISSAKGSYDAFSGDMTKISAKVIMLDRLLAQYGPDAAAARDILRRSVATIVLRSWPEDKDKVNPADVANPIDMIAGSEEMNKIMMNLSPKDEHQKTLKTRAIQAAGELGQMRWQLVAESVGSLPLPFLIVLIFWLMVLFASFGLLAPLNMTNICVLVLCAMSVAGALFLLYEMNHPLSGVMKIPSNSMLRALIMMGK